MWRKQTCNVKTNIRQLNHKCHNRLCTALLYAACLCSSQYDKFTYEEVVVVYLAHARNNNNFVSQILNSSEQIGVTNKISQHI